MSENSKSDLHILMFDSAPWLFRAPCGANTVGFIRTYFISVYDYQEASAKDLGVKVQGDDETASGLKMFNRE